MPEPKNIQPLTREQQKLQDALCEFAKAEGVDSPIIKMLASQAHVNLIDGVIQNRNTFLAANMDPTQAAFIAGKQELFAVLMFQIEWAKGHRELQEEELRKSKTKTKK